MMSLNPLLLVGGVIGTVSVLLLIAYACIKDKKTSMGFERSMADGEILRRLFGYAKPYLKQFVVVGFLVLVALSYDIASPLIVGYIEELVVGDFELKSLYVSVAVYAGVLVFSMASTYLQAVILQRVGQRIISGNVLTGSTVEANGYLGYYDNQITVIPEGNYGAGTVEIWDSGTYACVGNNRNISAAIKNGILEFKLHGHKLKGLFTLIHTNMDDQDRDWLLIKKDDIFAVTHV